MERIKRAFNALAHVNLFIQNDVPHQNSKQITRQQILSTRIYLILLVNILFILIMAASLNQTTTLETIIAPTLEKYQELETVYPTTLSCSCKQSTIPYGDFISVKIVLHPVTLLFVNLFELKRGRNRHYLHHVW